VSRLSRKCFSKERLDERPYILATTGFNHSLIPKHDETLTANSHKYGR
jgi:hypothetical protein